MSANFSNAPSLVGGLIAGGDVALRTTVEGAEDSLTQAADDLRAIELQHRIGEVLKAEVVDADSKIVQTLDSAIRFRAAKLPAAVISGDTIYVRRAAMKLAVPSLVSRQSPVSSCEALPLRLEWRKL